MNVGIIGGGAAGLMTAATLLDADPTARIFLIEKNDGLGKKVIISGGGRCNVTTGIHDVRTVLTKYPRGGKFLSSAMYGFPPEAVYAWFETAGVPLKREEDLRVFPQSDNGEDIVGVFQKRFQASRIQTLLKTNAIRIEKYGAHFNIFFKDQDAPLSVDRVVLTTGGQAYRHTGSTGDGYAFATALGHTLTPLAPSLNAFYVREKWTADVAGLSFQRARLTAKRGKKISIIGAFLFTHKGVTGPAVFALSSQVAFETYDVAQPLSIAIDLFPERTMDEIRHMLEQSMLANPKKSFANVLTMLMPKSLVDVLYHELTLPKDKRANEISKKDIIRCVTWLKGIPLNVIGRGAGDEFVTAGGINTKEVDPTTMESKICPGLYFAGEILDIDGYTGGFNLQASWATGHLAGVSISLRDPSSDALR